MIPVGEISPELAVAVTALVTAAAGAAVSIAKIGPERETTIVGAQDTVIDNLREEIDRYKADRDEAGKRHRERMTRAERRIGELEHRLEDERETCDRQIAQLQEQINELRERSDRRPG